MSEYDKAVDSLDLTLLNDLINDASKPVFGNWKDWSPDDFIQYATVHYEGMLRSQVRADTTDGGGRFFEAVKKRTLLEEVFPTKRYINWEEYSEQDFRDHYDKHFPGKKRSELAHDVESGGNGFYQAVRRRGLEDSVLPEKIGVDWISFSEKDFKDYYDEHFHGVKKSELIKDFESGGNAFYQAVLRYGFKDFVFPKESYSEKANVDIDNQNNVQNDPVVTRGNTDKKITKKLISDKWKEYSLQDFKDYYDEHCVGIGRKKASTHEDKEIRSFHYAVKRRGYLNEIFPDMLRTIWSKYSEQELADYIEENFKGMTRIEISKDTKNNGAKFYTTLRMRGLIDKIFPGSKKVKWTREKTVEIGLQLYKEHGKIPSQVNLYSMGLASFPGAARRHFGGTRNLTAGIDDFLNNNPSDDSFDETLVKTLKKPKYINFEGYSLDDFKHFYDSNFSGMSRSQMLGDTSNGGGRFYRALEKEGFVDQVFPEPEHKPRGYWSEERTLTTARELYKEHGKIPTIKELNELRLSYFLRSVSKYFGGLRKLRAMIKLEYANGPETEIPEELREVLSDE